MISVIIPCFNSEEFIERAVESVLNQTYKQYEIILVDNGSIDNTLNILFSYRDRYPDLIKVFQESKKGGSAARNKGLNEAKGEWIQFLDADDELLPKKFEEQVKIAHNLGSDLIISCFYKYYESKGIQINNIQHVESKNVWKGLINSKLGTTSCILWKREAVLRVNGWDEYKTSSQEYNLIFKMLKQHAIASFHPVALANIYEQSNSVHLSSDQKRSIEIANNFIDLRIEIKEYLIKQNNLTKELDVAFNLRMYEYLMLYKERMPEYVEKKLRELKLTLPLSFFIKKYLRRTRNNLREFKNAIIR